MKMVTAWAQAPQAGVAVGARSLCGCNGNMAERKRRSGSFGGEEVDHVWVVEGEELVSGKDP